MLFRGQRLARQRGFVNQETFLGGGTVGADSKELAVGRQNVTDTDDDDISRDKLGSIDVELFTTVPDDLGFGGDGFLEGFQGRFGLAFFDVADDGVENEEEEDDDKVDPVLEDTGEDDCNLRKRVGVGGSEI